jgi:hypothetical protein
MNCSLKLNDVSERNKLFKTGGATRHKGSEFYNQSNRLHRGAKKERE